MLVKGSPAHLRISIASQSDALFYNLGRGERERGLMQLAEFIHDTLQGTAYAQLVDYRTPEAIALADLHLLSRLSLENTGLLLVMIQLNGQLAAIFWGYRYNWLPENVSLLPADKLQQQIFKYETSAVEYNLETLGIPADIRGTQGMRRRLLARIHSHPDRVFYVDWVLTGRRFRRLGLARLLYTISLHEAFHQNECLRGYVLRTVDGNLDFMTRFYCREKGAKVLYSFTDGDTRRFVLGGTRSSDLAEQRALAVDSINCTVCYI